VVCLRHYRGSGSLAVPAKASLVGGRVLADPDATSRSSGDRILPSTRSRGDMRVVLAMTLSEAASWLAIGISVLTIGITISDTLARSARRRKAADGLKEKEFARALEAADIDVLGSYLYDTLGSVEIEDIVADEGLSRKVRSVVTAAREYLGTDAGEADESERPLFSGTGEVRRTAFPEARMQLARGNVWNALASVRRDLEKALTQLAERRGLEIKRRGLGSLIGELDRRGELPEGLVRDLRYATSVANRGVHGEDVEVGQATEAIDVAERTMRWILDHDTT